MKKIFGNKRTIAIFVLPTFLLYAVFALVPIIYNFVISAYSTNLMKPGVFVGFRNYLNLFTDSIFKKSLRNNVLVMIGSLAAHLPFALLLAHLLFQKIKGSNFFQTIFFFPCVICGVAVGMLWKFIYHSDIGLVNSILELIGRSDLCKTWLGDKNTAMICIIIVIMWQYVGYHMIIQLAAMKSIPGELYEVAKIDGANEWQLFSHITLPLIRNILAIDAVLIITGALKYYDLVAVMTNGGPNHATELMSTYMYYMGFRTLKYGYSAAIGVVMLILCMVSVRLANAVFKREAIEY